MRISHRHKFVFLAKYKCASSSVRNALNDFSDIRSSQQPPYYHHATLAEIERHFVEMGWRFDDYFVFTTVRRPLDMLSSLYEFGQPEADGSYWWERHWSRILQGEIIQPHERRSDAVVDFREWVLTHDLSRFRLDPFIRAGDGSIRANRVLRVESLEQDFAAVADLLGIGSVALPHRKKGTGLRRPFDAKMLARVDELFQSDIAWGGYEAERAPRPPRASSL